jgi:hypothetical protein
MVTTTLAAITNAQYLEGLYGLGVDYLKLRGISASGTQTSFKDRLRQAGVTDDQLLRAQQLVTWRPNAKDTPQGNLNALLDIVGGDYARRVADRANQLSPQTAGSDPTARELAIREIVPPTVWANMLIKTGRGTEVAPEAWNPFRGDKPASTTMAAAGAPPLGAVTQAVRAASTPVAPGGGTTGGGGGAGYDQAATPPPVPLTPEERRERIEASYGWAAALADDPEISKILNDVANGTISEVKADQLYKSSNFYKTFNSAAREWKIMERTDPVDARRKRGENLGIILDLARTMGITEPDMGRMERLNDFVLSTGISDREVKRMLASEVRYDPEGAKTGISAQLKNISREWLVPLSDQAMTSWVAGVAGGTKSTEDFTEYLRGMAKSMFPALGTALDDPNMTTRTYMDPYAQDTANLLGVNPADIDWMDPKYMRAFNQIDPKTNQRSVMSRSDWQRTLMKDPTYKYDETAHGKAQKQQLTTGLMEMFGFKFS